MTSTSKPVLFEAFTVSWLATVGVVRLKPTAYREYESVLRVHLIPAFGSVPIRDIAPEAIQSYIADKIASGLAPRTVYNHVIVIKAVLDTASGYGLIDRNPVDKVTRPRVERSEMRFLAPGQLRTLIEATKPSWRLLIALPALCGLRKGETLALTWDDIDLEARTISVNKSMRAGMVMAPKTVSSTSSVPLPKSVSSLIAERRRQARGHKLVFCKSDGSPLSDSTPNRILDEALTASGLPEVRYHDLRHSWAVAHLRAGTDVKTLAALGRWSSTTTLLETYAHVMPAAGGDAVRRMHETVMGQE